MQDILTVNELFSGIGAQRKALDRLGIVHEVVGVCEIDKYAIQSYEAIFGKTYNYGDICTAERLEYADLWTYSFPCQDISVAGRGKGINENTRSGLLYQVQRLLEVAKDEGKLPKYLLLENVKNLVGKKFKSQFDDWLFYLDQLGYDTYWQVLNAKHYCIPQNRERVFAISIRKDLNKTFEFPKPEELKIKLKDVLEDEVDEKYYLSEKMLKYAFNFEKEAKGVGFSDGVDRSYINPDIAQTIGCRSAADQRSGTTNYVSDDRNKIRVSDWKQSIKNEKVITNLRIRKLTPLECWRLMGFDDEDFRKAEASGVSNTQLYKQAGNSIVVNVLEKIFENLYSREN